MSWKQRTCRCFEVTVVTLIIITVWLLMFLPVAIYYLPRSTDSNSQQNVINSTFVNLVSRNSNDSTGLVCSEDFFKSETSQCKPKCSSWLMFSRTAETASLVLIGTATVVGILTTIVIIILSFAHFRNMLKFPSVLVLYQDIIVSVHGISILIGFGDRRLFCTSDDLVETLNSPASPYCTISGIISSYMVLPLTVWILVQVSYTTLAVYTPLYFKQLKKKKWRQHMLHLLSLLAGIVSLLFPSMLTLGLGGYSPEDTKFPPVVCFARNRDISVYVLLIPLGVLMAMIITELILIFYSLLRNTWHCSRKSRSVTKKSINKDFKKAEAKVIAICCFYVVIGLGASLAYAISSTSLRVLKSELTDYFECESVRGGLNEDQSCDRSDFERHVNATSKILGYSLLALYPVITLIYFLRKKRKPHPRRRTLTNSQFSTRSLTLTSTGL